MIAALAVIAQLSVAVHGPQVATACDAIEISVDVTAPTGSMPQLMTPSFAPFDVLRSSAVPRVSVDSQARGMMMAEYRYVLTTDRVGTFAIPPFEARVNGASARSRMLQLVVQSMVGRPSVPTVVARARIDTSLDVSFRGPSPPETVYVGQQANYEVAVFLNEAVRDRLRRNPTFFPPDMQSMLAYDIPVKTDAPRRQVSSHCFDALVYQRALFPLMPGRFAIPPAQLVYSLPLSASFFSREESHELQTDTTVLVAVAPPLAGRPADYGGAVGNLRVAARLDTTATRVGDPLTLTVRVSGTGNVKLLPAPPVGISWGTLVKGDERVQVDSTARKIAGSKEFDWVLTPRVAGELDVPPIHYSYFNPETRRYETASTSPTHVHIAPGALASADTARTQTLLSLRTSYRGPQATRLHDHPVFWAFLALVPFPALSFGALDRRRRATRAPKSQSSRLLALTGGPEARDPCHVRRVFASALSERLGLDSESFTRTGALARGLRRRGVSKGVALEAEGFLRELDEAAFSSTGTLAEDAPDRAIELYRSIDAEALPRNRIFVRTMGSVGFVLVGVLALGAVSARAWDVVAARTAFDRGVAAYEHHDFVGAREAFIASVATEPRAPDAWANLGTASWEVADTARSIAAWQRALRLEPLASDVRDRVELVHALPWSAAGFVVPIPVSWIFDTAALLWCLAWGTAAYRSRRRGDWSAAGGIGRDVTALALVAALVAVTGFAVSDRLSGRRLAVMRHTAALSIDPELGGERGATAIIGEVVRVTGRQGAWTRVVLDDGRDGWIDSGELMSLDVRDPPDNGGS